jgi:hypothetical protein
MYEKMLRQREDQDLQRRSTEARIHNLERPKARVMGREVDPNTGLTAYQKIQSDLAREREDRLASSGSNRGGGGGYAKEFNSAVGDEGIMPDMMAGVDTETAGSVNGVDAKTPGTVKYVDKDGKLLSAAEARMLGKDAFAVAPGLPPVSLPKWNRAVAAYKQMQRYGQGGVKEGPMVGPTPQDSGLSSGGVTDPDAVLRDARDAIKRGAPAEEVKKRLQGMGIDTSGL